MHLFQQIGQVNSKFKRARLVRHVHFTEYTEPSLDGTVHSEEELLGETPSFMRIKIGFICQISYEGRKTAASVGTLKRILGFIAVGIRQERHCFCYISQEIRRIVAG